MYRVYQIQNIHNEMMNNNVSIMSKYKYIYVEDIDDDKEKEE